MHKQWRWDKEKTEKEVIDEITKQRDELLARPKNILSIEERCSARYELAVLNANQFIASIEQSK